MNRIMTTDFIFTETKYMKKLIDKSERTVNTSTP